jgi:hypothetical protein
VKRFTVAQSKDFAGLSIVKRLTVAQSRDFAGLSMVKRLTVAQWRHFAGLPMVKRFTVAQSRDFAGLAIVKHFIIGALAIEDPRPAQASDRSQRNQDPRRRLRITSASSEAPTPSATRSGTSDAHTSHVYVRNAVRSRHS